MKKSLGGDANTAHWQ